jgi:hypothetical protein
VVPREDPVHLLVVEAVPAPHQGPGVAVGTHGSVGRQPDDEGKREPVLPFPKGAQVGGEEVGSMGTTWSTRYTLVPRFRASRSTGEIPR